MQARLDHLTFRGNLRETRHGWLRLTPAYSVHLVASLLPQSPVRGERVLDPFCGTGTTALVCAEHDIQADTTDINPFLVWLAQVKTRRYSPAEVGRFTKHAAALERTLGADARGRERTREASFVPALHQIEKWWDPRSLDALSRTLVAIKQLESREPRGAVDLLKVLFCQTLIASANVSFGHQSMSFAKTQPDTQGAPDGRALLAWQAAARKIAFGALSHVGRLPRVAHCDARDLDRRFEPARFSHVITSPPYPNRMSYVRELRPYMYWLGYLCDGRAAGELDWTAIGGTWGTATSRVARWEPEAGERVPFRGFPSLIARIAEQSPVLSRYVHKYFCDMTRHCQALPRLLKPGGSVHYIVGNSKFYDVVVPVERIFAALFRAAGLGDTRVRVIRKRSSKRELFEYVVSARK
jgi:tRNA1(Val) A37 N6-methylase TrmN6